MSKNKILSRDRNSLMTKVIILESNVYYFVTCNTWWFAFLQPQTFQNALIAFLPNASCNIEKCSRIFLALRHFLGFFLRFHLDFGYQHVVKTREKKKKNASETTHSV